MDGAPVSRRVGDMSAEAQLAEFLDRYLYAAFPDRRRYASIERVTDRESQLRGVDVRFTMLDGRVFNVDEKAQLYYLNRDLPTFAFELQFLRAGEPVTGWLCNERLDTDCYLLVWPFAAVDSPAGISWRDFTRADCLMLEKRALLRFLADNGLTAGRMLADAERLRAEGRVGRVDIDGLSGIYYYVSDPEKYAKRPINIVVTKKKLLAIAARRYVVTPDGVERS